MRLIDADALVDRIPNPYEQAEVARWVFSAPTLEPERKKGKWLRTSLYYPYCSECGWMPEEDEMRHMNYDFCPGCGSDMREEGDS